MHEQKVKCPFCKNLVVVGNQTTASVEHVHQLNPGGWVTFHYPALVTLDWRNGRQQAKSPSED